MRRNITEMVYEILEKHEDARNSDAALIYHVLHDFYRVDENAPVKLVLIHQSKGWLPSFESITRARRKVQENCAWLEARGEVKEGREEERRAYREEYGRD